MSGPLSSDPDCEFSDSGVPCAHRERRQSDQSERLKRILEQIASVSDGAKRRSKQKATSSRNACARIESVNRDSPGMARRQYRPTRKAKSAVNERAMDSPDTCAVANARSTIFRHVRSEDVPEGQKTDGVH